MEYKFTDANFEAEVLQSELPVLVDFYADWCGPCKMMAPLVKELAETYDGKVKVGKMNVDENPNTSIQYRVMSIPTFIIFKNGEKAASITGAVSKNELAAAIQQALA
ncbi:MAG: thioredoxin [Lachnospiraceae bacterium]|nr:thioredoxin [Lachnospiraceae bacterium]